MTSSKEVETIKLRLRKEAEQEDAKAIIEKRLKAYAKKSAAKIRRAKAASTKKKSKRKGDLMSRGTRLPGSAFSRGK